MNQQLSDGIYLVQFKSLEKNMLFSEKGKFYISLLLDPLMCKDITINARILGQKTDSGIAKMIPFKCGE